jgi:hypothetical protein
LCDMQALRRAGEMQLFGDCDQVAKMPKFHMPCVLKDRNLILDRYIERSYDQAIMSMKAN